MLAHDRLPPAMPAAIGLAWPVAVAAQASGVAVHVHQRAARARPFVRARARRVPGGMAADDRGDMLPSSLPPIRLLAAASREQPQPGRMLAAFLGGYAAV
jgi:hypothetical protein